MTLLVTAAFFLSVSCAGGPPPVSEEPSPPPAASAEPAAPAETAEPVRDAPPRVSPEVAVLVSAEAPADEGILPLPALLPVTPPAYPWEIPSDAPLVLTLEDDTLRETPPEEPAEEPAESPPEPVKTPAPVRPAARPPEPEAAPAVREEPRSLKSLEARPGTPFEYVLDGEGWVYQGSEPGGMRFVKRAVLSGGTEFTLIAEEPGEYRLIFIFNDILEGRSDRVEVLVSAGVEEKPAEGGWAEDLGLPEDLPDPGPPPPEEIVSRGFYEALQAADDAVKKADYRRAVDILQLCESTFSDSRDLDRIYFTLASIYEAAGPFRDIRRSIEYYRKILDGFPASIFYNRAAERIIYLERNFIRIR